MTVRRSRRMMRGLDRGITLFELLTVFVFIGLLAAIALPTFRKVQSNAYDAAIQNDLRNAVTQVYEWSSQNNGRMPGTSTPLVVYSPQQPNPFDAVIKPNLTLSSVSHTKPVFFGDPAVDDKVPYGIWYVYNGTSWTLGMTDDRSGINYCYNSDYGVIYSNRGPGFAPECAVVFVVS